MNLLPYNVVTIDGDRPTTTSLMVAEVFGKNHKNVLRGIETLEVSDEWGRLNFERTYYLDVQGKERPMYNITEKGFTLLVMGFTGSTAMKFKVAYIEAFEQMSETLKATNKPTAIEIAENYLASLKSKALLEQKIEQDAPKIEYFDKVADSGSLITTTMVAKPLGMSASKLHGILNSMGVLYKTKHSWVPYAKYQDKVGVWFKIVTEPYDRPDGTSGTSYNLKWFEAGKQWVVEAVPKWFEKQAKRARSKE